MRNKKSIADGIRLSRRYVVRAHWADSGGAIFGFGGSSIAEVIFFEEFPSVNQHDIDSFDRLLEEVRTQPTLFGVRRCWELQFPIKRRGERQPCQNYYYDLNSEKWRDLAKEEIQNLTRSLRSVASLSHRW
jgi:hypothetical protein